MIAVLLGELRIVSNSELKYGAIKATINLTMAINLIARTIRNKISDNDIF